MDYSPNGAGLIVFCAVSGSIVLLALQAQKRLLSDFIKRMEIQLKGPDKPTASKKTRSQRLDEKTQSMKELPEKSVKRNQKHGHCDEMPVNRQVLYRGMINYRNWRGQKDVADYF